MCWKVKTAKSTRRVLGGGLFGCPLQGLPAIITLEGAVPMTPAHAAPVAEGAS